MKQIGLSLLTLTLFTLVTPTNEKSFGQATSGCTWFVASTGSAFGDGSIKKPWSLEYIARGSIGGFIDQVPPAAIKPGDDICLLEGTYRGLYRTAVNGTAAAPIRIRAYPGARVIIDDGTVYRDCVANQPCIQPPDGRAATFTISSRYTFVSGLEITNSNPDRTSARLGGIGIDQWATGSKAYDNIIHDAGGLVSKNDLAANTEVSWNVGWNNGWDDRHTGLQQGGTGHGIYAANRNGYFRVYDNIMVNGFGVGFHAYSAGTGHLSGLDVQWNVSVDNGYWTRLKDSLYAPEGRATTNYLVGHRPISNLTFKNNFGFHREGRLGMNVDLGYMSTVDNPGPAVITDNTLIGGQNWLNKLISLDFQRNFVASNWPLIDWTSPTIGAQPLLDNQIYYFYPSDCRNGTQPFTEEPFDVNGSVNTKSLSVTQWNARGFDTHSIINPCGRRPAEVKVTIRIDPYDPNRSNVIVYNPGKLPTVTLDLSKALHNGDTFELRNVQDYFGPLAASGAYKAPVSIRMDALTVARPVGWTGPIIRSSGPDFGVFVLLKIKTALK
ncbi:MAG: hypothetical protein AABM67_13565 [Acidobacteriota bacterium]